MVAVLLVVLLAALSAAAVGSSNSVARLNGAGGPGGGSPWPEAASRRAQATLKQMSTDEKLLLTYGFNKPPPECPHREPHLCPHWYVGNVRAQPAFGLPPINLEDGPQGVADGLVNVTGWPSQLTVACAWDPELMRVWGAAMGAEQKLKGTNVMLGPDVNLARVPWSGRVFETNGEDPFLSSALVGPQIQGIQSNNISACVKHWIFNNHECNRQSFSANVAERVGRELYTPGFFAAVDAGVGSVMCAFNRVNKTFNCQSHAGLQSLLKQDGNFKGWVVTDWGAQHDLLPSANNGLDQQMEWVQDANKTRYGQPGFASTDFKAALANGSVPLARLDDMATRILTPMYALGLVDDPPAATHATTTESIVLLKNDGGLLPVAQPSTLSVVIFGDESTVHGSGSGGVTMPFVSLISASLKQMGFNTTYSTVTDPSAAATLAKAASLVVVAVSVATGEGMDRTTLSLSGGRAKVPYDQDKLVAAIGAAAGKKTVVVARCSGAFAMPWLGSVAALLYQLMPGQGGGVAAAAAIAGKINPSAKLPISMPTDIDSTWLGTPLNPAQYPGQSHQEAQDWADLEKTCLLCTTKQQQEFKRRECQRCECDEQGCSAPKGSAIIDCHDSDDAFQQADYSEGLMVGYRWYSTEKGKAHPPYFHFGHGLSYTSFNYSSLALDVSAVSFRLTNTGDRAGTEISQLYLVFPVETASSPLQLKGFAKTALDAGASARVTIHLSDREYSVWSDQAHAFVAKAGKFGVKVGSSSVDIRLSGTISRSK